MKTIWLAGATGLVGHACLEMLLGDPEIGTVVAVGRRAPRPRHAKLRWCETVRFDDIGGALARARPDAVLCALGTTLGLAGSREAFREVDCVYPLRLATAARDAGAGVFSAVTAVDAEAGSRVFYNRVKGELEEGLRALALPTVHVLHPSLLLGHREESRSAERLGAALAPVLSVLCRGPLRKYRPIEAVCVGRALARTADDRRPGWWVHEGEALRLSGA